MSERKNEPADEETGRPGISLSSEEADRLLPPKFLIRQYPVVRARGTEERVYLPDAEGRFQPARTNVGRIRYRDREIEVRVPTRAEKQRRRRLRTILIFCLSVGILILSLLVIGRL